VLRYDAPVMQGTRIATEAMQIGGCPVAAGQTINAMLYAANRDPEAHPDPKRFDIERSDKRHNSFGGGAHFCLGAPLARAEAQIALSMLLERFPKLRLRTDRPLERRTMMNFNGLEALWVCADQ
jgi:cytochrome P450